MGMTSDLDDREDPSQPGPEKMAPGVHGWGNTVVTVPEHPCT